jgi:hypothetical protein
MGFEHLFDVAHGNDLRLRRQKEIAFGENAGGTLESLDSIMKWLAAFFAFGTTMCALTVVLLLFPGTAMDAAWRLNPEAHTAFQSIGGIAILIMFVVGTGCAFAAAGLWRRTGWGIWIAVIILSINLAGDLFNAFVRHDYRALIGLPIGGAMIFYLVRSAKTGRATAP